ncbi:MAG TPA: lipopolysaccharide biosynthesis protein, partial [Anaerolineae bacterium]|nr:lipopolysaccharide biosynthesis protein [Anaerolineae bacterium]
LAGLILFAVAILVSPWAALFFEEATVAPMVQLLAVSFLITSLGSTHDALLQKELDFKKKTIPDLAQAFIRGVFSILLAWLGWGVWSLIWGQIIGAVAFTAAAWLVLPWRPSLTFNSKIAKELIGYGYQTVMGNFLAMLGPRTDYLFIGKLVGEVGLGFYTLAFRIPELMITSIMAVTSRVIFPAYAKLQHDQQVLQRAFLVTLQFLALVTFPLGVGLFAVAPDLIHVLYTDKWAPAIPVLQVLSLFALVRMIGSAGTGSIYKAIGRPDIVTKTSLLKIILLVPTSWWAVSQYGITGAAFAQLGVTVIVSSVNLYLTHKMLQLKISQILGEMRIAFLGAMLMFISVEIFLYLVPTMSSFPRLMIASTLGALVYILVIWLLSRETILLAQKLIGFAP